MNGKALATYHRQRYELASIGKASVPARQFKLLRKEETAMPKSSGNKGSANRGGGNRTGGSGSRGGNRAGWPAKTGNRSGGGHANAPSKRK